MNEAKVEIVLEQTSILLRMQASSLEQKADELRELARALEAVLPPKVRLHKRTGDG